MTEKIRVSIYEDNHSLRDSLKVLLEIEESIQLVGVYPDAKFIASQLQLDLPNVILMDLDMPVVSGIEATKITTIASPSTKVLILTVFDDDEKIFNSICAGAVGYILKKSESQEIIDGILMAHRGESPITPSIAVKILKLFKNSNIMALNNTSIELSGREKEILTLMTEGKSYKMIASSCNISIDTVRFHIKNIYEKLHVHSMTEAVSKALKEKLI